MTEKFIRFIGPFLNSRAAVVYQAGDRFIVRAETAGGKPVRRLVETPAGRAWRTIEPITMSREDFATFVESVTDGSISRDDASISRKALLAIGALDD